MCPPYCNECISLLILWLVSALRRRGILQRRQRERLVLKNSLLKSHLSCQRADKGHPGMLGLWCSESGHWPSFPPSPVPPPLLLQHTTYKTLLSCPISSFLYCHPDPNELLSSSANTTSPSLLFTLCLVFLLLAILVILEIWKMLK